MAIANESHSRDLIMIVASHMAEAFRDATIWHADKLIGVTGRNKSLHLPDPACFLSRILLRD